MTLSGGDDLPTSYDVIVIGTGMTESIIAAAASRIGKQVLHIDGNDYYGGLWASFNFDGLQKWVRDTGPADSAPTDSDDPDSDVKINNGEEFLALPLQSGLVSNVETKWFIPQKACVPEVEQWSRKSQTSRQNEMSEEEANEGVETSVQVTRVRTSSESERMPTWHSGNGKWTQEEILKNHHRFNFDLAPKLLFARGSLVELLISSNIARYTEFHAVNRVLTWLDGELCPVPCSRADVFATRDVSVVEKRMLMKLLTSCMESANMSTEFEGFENKTFLDYLKSKRLTPHLLHYVLYAIAMASDSTSCMEGVERTQRFLNSLGRYGNTPFLWPMYGTGELPQAFCRLCAVFGGVYCLQHPAKALLVSHNSCVGVVSCGQRLIAEHFVMGITQAPASYISKAPTNGISRAVFITNRSMKPAEKERLTLLQFPPGPGHPDPVTVIEVGPSTHACPKGLFVVHMTCRQHKTAKEDLQEVVQCLLKEKILTEDDYLITTDTQSTQTKDVSGDSVGSSPETKAESPDHSLSKPQIIWSMYYNCLEASSYQLTSSVPQNVHLCHGPDLELDFEHAVQQAKELFKNMYPDAEFLPRAPDPEEIILDGDSTSAVDSTSEPTENEAANSNEEKIDDCDSMVESH